jgi:predicted RNase H-like HicB family nuclease
MADMSVHRAVYEFDGRAWVVVFPDLGIATFGRTLAAAKGHARSALRVYLEVGDLAEGGVSVEDEVRLPGGANLGDVLDLRRDINDLRRRVASETRRATKELRDAGLSTRDVGDILGISSARVAQIEREAIAG